MDEEIEYRKKCKRYNIPRHAHYLTFSCFRRQAFLTRDRARHWLVGSILEAREKHDFRMLAWVFMPEHVHLLIHPRRERYSMSAILASVKLPVTIKVRNWVVANAPTFLRHMLDEQPNGQRSVRFWQRGGGYDRNVFSADEMWEKIGYIHRNPVRRKLAKHPVEWEWSSAADYAGVRKGPLPIDIGELEFRP